MFLDGLKTELEGAEARPVAGGARTNALNKLHDKIAGLRFLDPACGSGNFLTETYLELRRIENRILADLDKDGQLALDLGDDLNPVRVSISHFHGIEINGFACAVARTALWIAEQQALDDTESTISGLPRLPFTDTAHIQQGNALRLDWNELLPGDHCDYVMGNPPFIGHVTKTAGQTDDLKTVWGRQYDGYLDYATGWYRKAASYLSKPDAAFAFVTTNSITQGQPVEPLFKPLHADGWHIRFAHRTFAWDAQSTDNAHVHVVIIGLDRKAKPAPVLFEYPDISGEPVQETALNINGYLIDAPDLYVANEARRRDRSRLFSMSPIPVPCPWTEATCCSPTGRNMPRPWPIPSPHASSGRSAWDASSSTARTLVPMAQGRGARGTEEILVPEEACRRMRRIPSQCSNEGRCLQASCDTLAVP